ncbi:hypothetical protein ABN034_02455 [Actinopolymorpha sp. B11F2]|uniref:hypothetical protein n=1 Tax=Actinopolymorpha sp. B11F2 TaxID=3160862 RepID=UPI0032E3F85B
MDIDCDRCTMRGRGCHDCVVTVLLGGPPTETEGPRTGAGLPHGALSVAGLAGLDVGLADVELDEADRTALRVLADSGLVPRLPRSATMAVTGDRGRRRA